MLTIIDTALVVALGFKLFISPFGFEIDVAIEAPESIQRIYLRDVINCVPPTTLGG